MYIKVKHEFRIVYFLHSLFVSQYYWHKNFTSNNKTEYYQSSSW